MVTSKADVGRGHHATSGSIARNAVAGLTLAAITIPEQMATARLGGFEPQIGFYAFVGATVGFAIAGANRIVTVGADSTITPIFATALAVLAASSGASLPSTAVALALLVAAILLAAGILKLGWVADLLSTPIITGFLAGIAAHIVVAQLPDVLGLPAPATAVLVPRLMALAAQIAHVNPLSLAIAGGVLVTTLLAEHLNARIPGALIAIALATVAVVVFGLEPRGVAVLGNLPMGLPKLQAPTLQVENIRELVPLALLIALVVMMQTAAVSRSFPGHADKGIDRDFIGLSVANLGSALLGSFPVNASPPRTAVVNEAGGTSQAASLVAAAVVAALAFAGGRLLAHVPYAALAGVLLFVAVRIVRVGVIAAVARQAPGEFALIVITAAAVIFLPVPTGVAIGIGLSLVHGVWITTQTKVTELRRVPGTTIWWPAGAHLPGESPSDALVLGFPAPILFANAETFKKGMLSAIGANAGIRLVVLEGGGIAYVDYTAAQTLREVIEECRARNIEFAIARLESVRAHRALDRFGVVAALGADRIYLSVAQAVSGTGPHGNS